MKYTARADANKSLYGGNDMKTKFKLSNRILSIVLALVLMVGILPTTSFTASAAETEYDGVIGELTTRLTKRIT